MFMMSGDVLPRASATIKAEPRRRREVLRIPMVTRTLEGWGQKEARGGSRKEAGGSRRNQGPGVVTGLNVPQVTFCKKLRASI